MANTIAATSAFQSDALLASLWIGSRYGLGP